MAGLGSSRPHKWRRSDWKCSNGATLRRLHKSWHLRPALPLRTTARAPSSRRWRRRIDVKARGEPTKGEQAATLENDQDVIEVDAANDLRNSIGLNFRLIPAGAFTMGDASGDMDEKPHKVTLTKPFYIGIFEVTNAQWKRVMGSMPSNLQTENHPVEQVTWGPSWTSSSPTKVSRLCLRTQLWGNVGSSQASSLRGS